MGAAASAASKAVAKNVAKGAKNLLPGQKPYTIKEFINKYRKK